MAELNVQLPDDLDDRLRRHVREQGGDVSGFVAEALRQRLDGDTYGEDPAEVEASLRRGLDDVEAGRVSDARAAMLGIAATVGIRLDQ